jgi:hypothetical protein
LLKYVPKKYRTEELQNLAAEKMSNDHEDAGETISNVEAQCDVGDAP